MAGERVLLKPGTLFMIALMGAVAFAMYSWATTSFSQTRNKSLENQEAAIECSNVNVDLYFGKFNGTHQAVHAQVNRPVRSLLVNFQGDGNFTRVIEEPRENAIITVNAPMEEVSRVEAIVSGCDRVFSKRRS